MDDHTTTLGATVAALLGGGGLVGWYRERRKGRKDANAFALSLIEAQNTRIDNLTLQVGELSGRVMQLTEQNSTLQAENVQLKTENAALIAAANLVVNPPARKHRKTDPPGEAA